MHDNRAWPEGATGSCRPIDAASGTTIDVSVHEPE